MGAVPSCLEACLPQGRPPGLPDLLLEDGTKVIVRGLVNAAHHNGKEGIVCAYEPDSGRYAVALPDGNTISVRSENLLQAIGVMIIDLQGRGELNGLIGRIVGSDGLEQRYHVSVRGQVMALAPTNALLPNGARVRVQGLEQQPQYNGLVGVVVDVDRTAKRYVVVMGSEHQLRVRFDNVRL